MSEMSGVERELADEMTAADVFGEMSDKRVARICEMLAKVAVRYFGDVVAAVDIDGARVAVERVQAYGLEIEVDANGRASSVRFPYGARVAEWWRE